MVESVPFRLSQTARRSHGVSMTTNISSLANLIWSVADLLRGDFKQSQYGRIILPFTVLRRLECVLAPTRDKVLATAEAGLAPVIVVGEDVEGASAADAVRTQFDRWLDGFPAGGEILVAYEPAWAIGRPQPAPPARQPIPINCPASPPGQDPTGAVPCRSSKTCGSRRRHCR